MTNKELCERYPFLLPWKVREGRIKDFNYSYTLLDWMEPGWRKAFGLQFCEELREALLEADILDKYQVMDVKEKYGELRWYSYGGANGTCEIEKKYLLLSRKVCGKCGKPATHVGVGWIYPYCEDCAPENARRIAE